MTPQYNKFSTQKDKLSSEGKYINTAAYKLQSTFAYSLLFNSLLNFQGIANISSSPEEETEPQRKCFFILCPPIK